MKSSSTSLIDHPVNVTPVTAFPRVLLPIDWIIGSSPRVFTAHRTKIIPSSNGVESVMIAKVEGEKNMVVIEQIDKCIYTMCTLRKDLKLKDVRVVAKASKDIGPTTRDDTDGTRMELEGSEWWRGMMARSSRVCPIRSVSLQFLINDNRPIQFVPQHNTLMIDQVRFRTRGWKNWRNRSLSDTIRSSQRIPATSHLLRIPSLWRLRQ